MLNADQLAQNRLGQINCSHIICYVTKTSLIHYFHGTSRGGRCPTGDSKYCTSRSTAISDRPAGSTPRRDRARSGCRSITSCRSYKYQDTFHDSPQNPAVSVDVKRVDQVLEAARCQKLVQLHVPHCVPLHLTSFFVSGETQTADNASAFLWIKHTDLKQVKPFPRQFNAEIPLTFIIQTAT